jgi:hypothetical protein
MTDNQRQMLPDNNNSEVAHLMNVLVKELRGYVIEQPLCAKEAAEFLKIHQRTLEKWMKNGVIPKKCIHYKASRPYFFPSELRDDLKRS